MRFEDLYNLTETYNTSVYEMVLNSTDPAVIANYLAQDIQNLPEREDRVFYSLGDPNSKKNFIEIIYYIQEFAGSRAADTFSYQIPTGTSLNLNSNKDIAKYFFNYSSRTLLLDSVPIKKFDIDIGELTQVLTQIVRANDKIVRRFGNDFNFIGPLHKRKSEIKDLPSKAMYGLELVKSGIKELPNDWKRLKSIFK